MELPYRLIALDVDGTLLNDDHVITEGTKQAVRLAAQAGATIVLCTGRGPSHTFHLMEQLELKGLLIAHNGAATIESQERKLLHGFSFQMEDLAELIAYCRAKGIHYNSNDVFDLYIDQISPREEDMYERFTVRPIRVADVTVLEEPVLKFSLFSSMEDMDRVEQEWEQIGCKLVPIRSGDFFIDVMHPQATKGNALKQLAESMGIPREQVLAIGNYFNDVAMLEYAGMGIAMANSPAGVIAAADETTLSNNEEGVRVALLRHVLGQE